MIRFMISLLLLCNVVNAQSVFFSIKKGNKRYETTHVYISVFCLPKAFTVSIRFKKPQDAHSLKKQNKKLKYQGKKPNSIEFPYGKVLACKEGKAEYLFDGQLSISQQKIYLVLRKGLYQFKYKDHVISFHYSSKKQGIEIPNRVMIDMAATFYKKQKEIPRTAVIPGACQ